MTATAKNEKEVREFETLGFTRDGTRELTEEERRQLRFSLMGKETYDLKIIAKLNGGRVTRRMSKEEFIEEMLDNGWY